jgi:hypothetical protein
VVSGGDLRVKMRAASPLHPGTIRLNPTAAKGKTRLV